MLQEAEHPSPGVTFPSSQSRIIFTPSPQTSVQSGVDAMSWNPKTQGQLLSGLSYRYPLHLVHFVEALAQL